MRKRLTLLLLVAVSLSATAGLRHIRAGALAGNAALQLQLGELYQYGSGLHNRDVPALAWYLVAAHSGAAGANARAKALEHTMTPAARAAAHAKSEALLQRIGAPRPAPAVPPLQSPKPAK
ncbi:MAG: hypothetical protein ACYCRH_10730 [Acidiferrobacteraceae bacterium]